jgi:hypothetical protein
MYSKAKMSRSWSGEYSVWAKMDDVVEVRNRKKDNIE